MRLIHGLLTLSLVLAAGCSDDDSESNSSNNQNSSNSANNANSVNNSNSSNNANSTNGMNSTQITACETAVSSSENSAPIYAAVRGCFVDNGADCAADDASLTGSVDAFTAALLGACADEDFAAFQDGKISRDAWAARVGEFHVKAAQAIARKAYGGPNGVLLEDIETCSHAVYDGLVDAHLAALGTGYTCTFSSCAAPQAPGAALREAAEAAAATCGDDFTKLADTTNALARVALDQTACVAAAIRTDALGLECGPDRIQSVPAVGEWTQVRLEGNSAGAKCGDGSDYYFWMKLGTEANKVVIDLQGGGVCLQGGDCKGRPESLFRADDDMPEGPHLQDSQMNAFNDWTMVYLPYCTQDVHLGAGTTESFVVEGETFEVQRYGGVNVREAVKHVRDTLWAQASASETEDGFQNSPLTLIGGTSAGGFGTYPAHAWVMDELGWRDAVAMPRVWLSISADPPFSLANLAGLKGNAWGVADTYPSYCNAGRCIEGLHFVPIHAARLNETPYQHMMIMSSQADLTQSSTTYHPSVFRWTNLVREYYCELQGTANTNWFLYANDDLYQSLIDGGNENGHSPDWFYDLNSTTPMMWMADAMQDLPTETPSDFVNEGEMVQLSKDEALLGVDGYEELRPFTCAVTEVQPR